MSWITEIIKKIDISDLLIAIAISSLVCIFFTNNILWLIVFFVLSYFVSKYIQYLFNKSRRKKSDKEYKQNKENELRESLEIFFFGLPNSKKDMIKYILDNGRRNPKFVNIIQLDYDYNISFRIRELVRFLEVRNGYDTLYCLQITAENEEFTTLFFDPHFYSIVTNHISTP